MLHFIYENMTEQGDQEPEIREPYDAETSSIAIGDCMGCLKQNLLTKEIPLGIFCFECLRFASRIKSVKCPVCTRTLMSRDYKNHHKTCVKVKTHNRTTVLGR